MKGVTQTVDERILDDSQIKQDVSLFADLATLFKLRVTSLVVMTAWAGYFLAAKKLGVATYSWQLLGVLAGVGAVSGGAAALNQVVEREADAQMARTKNRPVPAGRMQVTTGFVLGGSAIAAGTAALVWVANPLTGILALLTAAAYILVYTPLKKVTPVATLVGAFPGAMPPLLGWVAVMGRVEPEALALFAILFFWQFPHFLAIAWLYRDDYANAGIRMRPVIDTTGRATIVEILANGVVLIPVTLAPLLLGLGHTMYAIAAVLLGIAYLIFGIRLANLRLPPSAASTKKNARQLLQASIVYLPLLFLFLILDGTLK